MTSLALALRPTAAAMARSQISRALALLRSPKCVLWQDASDLSTLFQDSAGTTPVTAVEQPVGLMLDKKTAGQPGPELVTNGDGSSLTGWTGSSGYSVVSGAFKADGTTAAPILQQTIAVQQGKTYRVTFTQSGRTAGNCYLVLGGTQPPGAPNLIANQTYSFVLSPSNTSGLLAFATPSGVFDGSIDNISVREIPGVHFIQATPASRPTLSSRYNLLTESEFRNGVTDAPIRGGLLTAATLTGYLGALAIGKDGSTGSFAYKNIAHTSGVTYVFSVIVEMTDGLAPSWGAGGVNGATSPFALIANGQVASLGSEYVVTPIAGSVYRVSWTYVASGANGNTGIGTYAANNNRTFKVTGYDLKVAADASLPYQRVNTSSDYDFDFSKFPAYLRYDGVDDSQASATTVDLTGTDKITVVGAWHKASDAADTQPLGFGDLLGGVQNGVFSLDAPGSGAVTKFQFNSKGTSTASPFTISAAHNAPATRVVSGLGDIAGDSAVLRLNGSQVAVSSSNQGTGNYGNYTMFVGSRNGSSLRFNGREYGFALFNTTLTASELAAVEAYFRAESRAY